MPAISATAAQNFPASERGDKTSGVYACYSLGTVVGLIVTPILAEMVGWTGCVGMVGIIGIAIAIVGLVKVENFPGIGSKSEKSNILAPNTAINKNNLNNNNPRLLLLCCCWFFTLQQWMPMFLNGFVPDLKLLGLISALPWMGTALVSALSGKLSLHLARRDWSSLSIRRLMQTTSSFGIACCLVPLVLVPNINALTAIPCMTLAVACQGMCYPGYHAFVQDAFANEAGTVLALTNSASIVAGVCGNLLCGMVGDFRTVFLVVLSLYAVSGVTFLLGTRMNA